MTRNTIKNEILSPAGSIETLYAGINAGADAVYIGGQLFGARAYAENPDNNELLRAIDYVHLHDKKLYLTVNTLLKNSEIEDKLYHYLLPLYEQGLDAVIVQDIGVFNFIKENFSNLDIHASTQMTITGADGASLLKQMGASRIVTARELSLSELKDIHDHVDIEIESFIHGAMCYSYSGMCLFSSIIGGRSGNRGRCAGPCRQPYEVYKNRKKLNDKNNLYALSLKDMNTLEILPEIIDSGVYSLKIEGRMKSPEYAAGVVSIYRKYLDLYHEKGMEYYQLDKNDVRNLSELYTRSGSVTGYYKCHNSKNMISFQKPAYKSDNEKFIAEVHEKYCGKIAKQKADAKITLEIGKPMKLEIFSKSGSENVDDRICISVTGENVGQALKRPIDASNIYKQINKTGDSFWKFDDINIIMDDNIFVPISHLNELRREAIETYEKTFLKKYRRTIAINENIISGDNNSQTDNDNINKDNNSMNLIQNIDVNCCNNNIYDHKINISCQINTKKQLECVLKVPEINEIYVSTDILTVDECITAIDKINANHKKGLILLPFIYREHAKKYISNLMQKLKLLTDRFNTDMPVLIIRNIDELGIILEHNYHNFRIDNSLYSFNRYSKEFFYHLGAEMVTLPYELNFNELKKLADTRDELVIYGRVPLMITAGCVNKNFDKCEQGKNSITKLKDRKSTIFPSLSCCNFCYNIIYNSVPLSLIGAIDKVTKIHTKNYRINLTLEEYENSVDIIEKCIKIFYYNQYSDENFEFTRGHFNRGVE